MYQKVHNRHRQLIMNITRTLLELRTMNDKIKDNEDPNLFPEYRQINSNDLKRESMVGNLNYLKNK